MMNRQEIGARLKAARARKRLTQAEVAKAMGIAQGSLSEWENGRHLPDMTKILELAEYLGMDNIAEMEASIAPDRTPLSDLVPDMVAVPEYDVRVAAGGGALAVSAA